MTLNISSLVERLEDERDEVKDRSRIAGEFSALDPMTAQRIANTMFEAGETISALTKQIEEGAANRDKLQRKLWTVLKERRDITEQNAITAARDLEEAIANGWDSHLPSLDEVQAAGPYIRVGWDETLEEATARAQRECGLSRAPAEQDKSK